MKNSTNMEGEPSRIRTIAYWITTGLVVANLGIGCIVDIIGIPYIRKMGLHLGYPDYMSLNLAIWEGLAVIALLIPGYLRLKEWAYAGAFFLFTGAVFSRIAIGDPIKDIIPPVMFAGLTIASWYLRPLSRKLQS